MWTSRRYARFAHLLAAALLFAAVVDAEAQTAITSLPYTISTSGLYILNGDLNSSQTTGDLITINASNVTIDFQGHYIAGPVSNTNTYIGGIFASGQRNLKIRNGTVSYCGQGISLLGNGQPGNSANHVVEQMLVTHCYGKGIAIYYSLATRVTDCRVSGIGYEGGDGAFGIVVIGSGVTVQKNVVSDILGGDNTHGIDVQEGNFVRQNTVSNAYDGVSGGKEQDNLTSGCTVPFNAGIDAPGNN